jgi:molybdenum storage protein
MSLIRDADRTDIDTPFREISFSSAAANKLGEGHEVIRILPDVHVIKVGGQSFMDRGRSAVIPLVEEIAALQVQGKHDLLVGVGGGTRARHAYAIALDLGMPTSVLAKVGQNVPVQNARLLQLLLAKHGGILIDHDMFGHLPLYYRMGCIPVMPGMPPFSFWEKPGPKGRIPTHRTDAGVYLTAEVMGAASCIFVKDEKGLYTANPKVDPNATFIPRISVKELKAMNLPDLVVEPVVLDYLQRANSVREIQIIDGRVPGNLTKALNGEHVGSIIYAD